MTDRSHGRRPSAHGRSALPRLALVAVVLFAAGAHGPCVIDASPRVRLEPGANALALGALAGHFAAPPDGAALLEALAREAPVHRIDRIDAATGALLPCSLGAGVGAAGPGCAAVVGADEAGFAHASHAGSLPVPPPRACAPLAPRDPVRLVALPCAAPGLRARGLLAALEAAGASASVARHDPASGRWTEAVASGDGVAVPDFPIERGRAYRVTVDRPVVLAAPVARAGSDTVARLGARVGLDGGASSDPDGAAPLTFRWSLLGPGPCPAVLDAPAIATPGFVAGAPGEHVAVLHVSDGVFESPPAAVRISVPDVARARVSGNVFVFGPGGGLLRDAEISILELPGRTTRSGGGGAFAFDDVPVGPVTLVLSHPDHAPTQTGALDLGPGGLDRVTLQTPTRLLFTFLATLLGVVPDPARCQIASTVTREGASLYGPDPTHGEPGATVTIDPPLPASAGPIYFAQLGPDVVLPDRSLAETSEDGGVLFVNAPPGDYELRAWKPGRVFAPVRVACRAGLLVNPSPPWGLQALPAATP